MSLVLNKFKRFAVSIRDALNPKRYLWQLYVRIYKDEPFIIRMKNGQRIRTYSNDIIGKNIFEYGVFEKAEVAFVTRYLKPGMIFLDIGANLGQYTLLGAKCVGKKGRVHSFEPSTRMFGELEYNVKLNSLSETCVLNKLAVADTNSMCRLSKYERGSEVYGSIGNQHWAHAKIIGYEDVKTIKIDDYLQRNGASQVDLIKMDIEGAELLALKGCEKLLFHPNSPAIIMEVAELNTAGFGYKSREILDYLEQFGYSFHFLDKYGFMAGVVDSSFDFANGINLVATKN